MTSKSKSLKQEQEQEQERDQTPKASAMERRVTFFVQSHKESNQRKGFWLFRVKSHECGACAGRSHIGHPAQGGTRRTSMCAALRVSLVPRVTSGARQRQKQSQTKAKSKLKLKLKKNLGNRNSNNNSKRKAKG
ncbi:MULTISPECIES: hypothetical protein [Lysobacter]|uniref:hypothetical protein n=1 Tax=Lysobacter TaxID=68 RepID=UPI001F22E807|nr:MULTISPECIES: hypothetical protein [Lysobacter]UJB20912.1 hypothetical protein L1A79_07570 [Lysobacter capsici]UJQ29974.1 hypothetical protein L2D09_07290 [Lysobacter gummosus]